MGSFKVWKTQDCEAKLYSIDGDPKPELRTELRPTLAMPSYLKAANIQLLFFPMHQRASAS